MLRNYLNKGLLFDEPANNPKYPETAGYIITSNNGRAQVFWEDIKDFKKFEAKCLKNNLNIKELIRNHLDNNLTVPFSSARSKSILKDSPFFIG